MENGLKFTEGFSLISLSKKYYFALLLIICGFGLNTHAQLKAYKLTGNTAYDVEQVCKVKIDNPLAVIEDIPGKKSLFLAGALSAILPGAGEFYSEAYIKSAIFLGVEVAAIIAGLVYDKKGDDQTNYFESFAKEHWDVKRYARWTLVHANTINPSVNPSDYNVFMQNGEINWTELNRLETEIGQSTNYYSHRLAFFGDQQYFEMIGKYPQFNPGWDDFGNENTPYHYGDPLTQRFLYYSGERAKANDFYSIASKAVMVIVTNHVLSFFDAIWSASSYNKSLQMNVTLRKDQVGYRTDYSTVLNLKYNF